MPVRLPFTQVSGSVSRSNYLSHNAATYRNATQKRLGDV
jgi:hypothetical protein